MKAGYYFKPEGGEFFYLSGKKAGNRYYNTDADEPRWEGFVHWIWNVDADYLKDHMYSSESPVPHYTTQKWEAFVAKHKGV
jgi:hypothetical protein